VSKKFPLPAVRLPKWPSVFAKLVKGPVRPSGEEPIDSVISAGTTIRGDIGFSGVMRIDGLIEGRVEAQSEQSLLIVGQQAHLKGDISAVDAVICGMVEGNVVVQRFLELRPGARVVGDVTYSRIEVHVGATVDGRMVHADDHVAGFYSGSGRIGTGSGTGGRGGVLPGGSGTSSFAPPLASSALSLKAPGSSGA